MPKYLVRLTVGLSLLWVFLGSIAGTQYVMNKNNPSTGEEVIIK